MTKIPIGILGATGLVGQQYVLLLANHPWFEISYLAASSESAGKSYADALLTKKYRLTTSDDIEQKVTSRIANMQVFDAADIAKAKESCRFVFSAADLGDKERTKEFEFSYARAGIPILSNSSANRWTPQVPVMITEINADHHRMIPYQQATYGFPSSGFIVSKPNCSIQSFMLPIYALQKAGYDITELYVVTAQAISGAGVLDPADPKVAVNDNFVPYINGEEEKTEKEPTKIFGSLTGVQTLDVALSSHLIRASCGRSSAVIGHLATVFASINRSEQSPQFSIENIVQTLANFKSPLASLDLPSAPLHPIVYRSEPNRPQPILDSNESNGMAVVVGRVRVRDNETFSFVGLSNNLGRGAAGGSILNAEYLAERGYFN